MWNEKHRTQKIGFELERLKRELEEQEQSFADLMRENFVSAEDLEAAGAELAQRGETQQAPTETAPVRPDFKGAYVVRG